MDDGHLKRLPHPGEAWSCQKLGLTLCMASDRGRLYRESFYVCRTCGREGETLKRQSYTDALPSAIDLRKTAVRCWASAALIVPPLLWLRWWEPAAVIGLMLLVVPGVFWREKRKEDALFGRSGLPLVGAPGAVAIPEPTAGTMTGVVLGRPIDAGDRLRDAAGPCCDRPDWVNAAFVDDAHRVPCCRCERGVMRVSEQGIH